MKHLFLAMLIVFSPLSLAAIKHMAMIKNGVIENVALWDGVSSWSPPGFSLVDITAQPSVGIGWTHNGGSSFTAPVAIPEPESAVDKLVEELDARLKALEEKAPDPKGP